MNSPVPLVGIVGGVGSGKSSLARWVAEHHPAVVLDADGIGHELLGDPEVRSRLRELFGDGIFNSAGAVHRPALAARVFGASAEHRKARHQLDALLHPLIRKEIVRRVGLVDPKLVRVVFLDAALLLEAGWRDVCRAVVFIDTPEVRRAAWVQANRGWSLDELHRREASQWSLEKKRQAADVVIANTGEIAEGAAALLDEIQQFL